MQNVLIVNFHSIFTIVRSWSAQVISDHHGVTGETMAGRNVAVKVLSERNDEFADIGIDTFRKNVALFTST